MKKILILSLLALTTVGLMSCGDDDNDAPALGANVQVTVKNLLGTVQSNTTVYLFIDTEVDSSTRSVDADKYVVTDEHGVAIFNLNFTELKIFESKTTLTFAVFYEIAGIEVIAPGSSDVTVKRNDEKKLTLTIPI